jgi:hypothetical protein
VCFAHAMNSRMSIEICYMICCTAKQLSYEFLYGHRNCSMNCHTNCGMRLPYEFCLRSPLPTIVTKPPISSNTSYSPPVLLVSPRSMIIELSSPLEKWRGIPEIRIVCLFIAFSIFESVPRSTMSSGLFSLNHCETCKFFSCRLQKQIGRCRDICFLPDLEHMPFL